MILKQFSLIHYYPHNSSTLSMSLEGLRHECKQLSPGATEPKLGDHTTLLPPFHAHPDEMRQFSAGLNIARALYDGEKGSEIYAETQGLGFFRNPGVDALIVKILLPKNYHAMIGACREQLSEFNEWVFPPFGGAYTPHICILEGPNLYEDLHPHLAKLRGSVFIIRFPLLFPKIMIKIVDNGATRWEEFDPTE